MIRSTGLVTAINSPSTGWYKVALTHAPDIEVTGTSLKGTAMAVGQEVVILEYGRWGNVVNEFGFVEISEAINGQMQLSPSAFDQIAKTFPGQVSAAYIANKTQNNQLLYKPATITAISGGLILATDDYDPSNTGTMTLRVSSDLNVNDFKVGDRVLFQTVANKFPVLVLGWWQTVPNSQYWQLGLNIDLYYTLWNIFTDEIITTGIKYDSDWSGYSIALPLFFKDSNPCFVLIKNDGTRVRIYNVSTSGLIFEDSLTSVVARWSGYAEYNPFSELFESFLSFSNPSDAILEANNLFYANLDQNLFGTNPSSYKNSRLAFFKNGFRFLNGTCWNLENIVSGTLSVIAGMTLVGLDLDGVSTWSYSVAGQAFVLKNSIELIEYSHTTSFISEFSPTPSGFNQNSRYVFFHFNDSRYLLIFDKQEKTFTEKESYFGLGYTDPSGSCSFVKNSKGIL
jgi:hypothetical protein